MQHYDQFIAVLKRGHRDKFSHRCPSFGAGLAGAAQHRSTAIHLDQIARADSTFMHTTRGHQQAHGLTLQHAAEVAACAIAPAPLVDGAHALAEGFG